MPLTEQGFDRLTYSEILQQQITRARELFGDDADTSEKSVLGKYIRLNVADFAQQEETLEATPHKDRLTALLHICLHIFRYLAQKFLYIR